MMSGQQAMLAPPDRAAELIGSWCAEHGRAPAPGEDWRETRFAELGLGRSDVLSLLVALEDGLQIEFANEDLAPENLVSPAALGRLAGRKKASLPACGRKRLVHVTSEFLPHLSGPQRLITDLWEQLSDSLDFSVCSYEVDRRLPAQEQLGALSIHRHALPRATELCRLRERFRRFADRPDLDAETMCNYQLASTGVFADLQLTRPDAIVSYFYAGILAQDVIDFFPSREWILIPSFFQPPAEDGPGSAWWSVQRVDKLLLFQDQDRRAALAYGVPEEKITLLPFPVNTDRFRPLPVPRDPDVLLYVGRLTANKGIRAFLETFRWMLGRRRSLRLRLVADLDSTSPAEQQELPRLRAAVAKLGLANNVEFAGRREGDALVEEYSRCRIHILPSIGDCYSLATLEALACGLSCVNLDHPRYEWQRRRDEGTPLVHTCPSLPEMGATILRLLESGEFPDHRPYVLRNLSWRQHRDAYRDFFLR